MHAEVWNISLERFPLLLHTVVLPHKSQIKNTFHLILENKCSIHKFSKKSNLYEAFININPI